MADLDLEELLNLSKAKISLDLSKVLSSTVLVYVSAFVPGFFFLASVLLGDPDLSLKLAGRLAPTQQAFESLALGHYLKTLVLLTITFAVGYAFLLVDTLISWVLVYVYRSSASAWSLFCLWPLRPSTEWLLMRKMPAWLAPWLKPRIARFSKVITAKAFSMPREETRLLGRCWQIFAERLVVARYGVEPDHLDRGSWEVLYWVLGNPVWKETRGLPMMIAIHATGWAGIYAARIAPSLRNRYYLPFCTFLVLNGLIHDYYVVKARVEPEVSGYANLRAVLKALGEAPRHPTDEAAKEG
jgi:hypothetical protein